MAGELWVDYKAIKAAVTIEMVLGRYGLLEQFTRKGDRISGKCPVHKGSNTRQFSADVKKGAWKCFSGHCGKSGNVIDLVAAIEGVEFREAALLMQVWFGITPRVKPASELKEKPGAEEGTAAPVQPAPAVAATELKENKPLTFQLKLDPTHPYLASRGLTPQTAGHFGLGLAGKGSMAGRLAIPIHNDKGELVAYAGRWIGKDEALPAGEGKYKLPPGFHKSLVVYNLHRVPEATKTLILVEGFWSVFWLHQNGYPNVVSLMGSSCSPEQAELLAPHAKGVQIFFDGDEAGREGSRKVALELAPKVWVKIVECSDGLQPDRLPTHELKRLLG
jgi:DNA primase